MKYNYKNKKQKNGQFSFVHIIRGFLEGLDLKRVQLALLLALSFIVIVIGGVA